MSRRLMRAFLSGLILVGLTVAQPARAESPERRAALKMCRQKYKEMTKGAKYLKGADRRARIEAAQEERRKCKALAPAK